MLHSSISPTKRTLSLLSIVALCACLSCDIKTSLKPEEYNGNPYDEGVIIDGDGRLVITQFGISWQFDTVYEYGQFANGDYWVVGPVTITAIYPMSRKIDGRTKNGSMINPSPQNGTRQGYDSTCYATEYDASLNAALNVSSTKPLVLQNGSSLVSSISIIYAGTRPQLKTAAVLTVLAAVPAEGSFRPPYSGSDKTIRYNTGMLNRGLLQNLEPVDETPSMADVERYFERPWIDHVPGWSCGSVHPLDNMPDYGREIGHEVGTGALMLHLNFTGEEKETLLISYVQMGIDLYGIIQDGGIDNWHNDGGHASGRKWPILFAGLVLGDAGMQGIGALSGDYLYSDDYGPGNIPPDYIHFGEDDQTFYVTADDVALSSTVTENPGSCGETFYGHFYPSDCNDYPEYADTDIGMPEWGIRHSSSPLNDGNTWPAAYRDCCTAISWSGSVLAARIMGADNTLWNHQALFDYQDRYMAVTADADMDPPWRTAVNANISTEWSAQIGEWWAQNPGWRAGGFTGNMWDTYRDDF